MLKIVLYVYSDGLSRRLRGSIRHAMKVLGAKRSTFTFLNHPVFLLHRFREDANVFMKRAVQQVELVIKTYFGLFHLSAASLHSMYCIHA
jgi:hypothetical protein